MADFDIHIKGGTIVDGTRVPRYRGDLWIKDGKIAQLGGRAPGFAKKTIDADGLIVAPGLRRSAYALRCADSLGSLLHHLRMARRHVIGVGQLRLRLRPRQARVPRPLDAHDDPHRGHPLRRDEGGHELGLGDDSRIPGFARPLAQGRQLYSVHADRLADDLCDGPRSREDAPRQREGAGRDGAPAARGHGRRAVRLFDSTARSATRCRPTSTARRWSPTRCATRTSSTSRACCASATKASWRSRRRPAEVNVRPRLCREAGRSRAAADPLPGHCARPQERRNPSPPVALDRGMPRRRACRFSARARRCAAASPSRSSTGTFTI